MKGDKCDNRDEECGRAATRSCLAIVGGASVRIRVCRRCYRRYLNHGDGVKGQAWERKRKGRK